MNGTSRDTEANPSILSPAPSRLWSQDMGTAEGHGNDIPNPILLVPRRGHLRCEKHPSGPRRGRRYLSSALCGRGESGHLCEFSCCKSTTCKVRLSWKDAGRVVIADVVKVVGWSRNPQPVLAAGLDMHVCHAPEARMSVPQVLRIVDARREMHRCSMTARGKRVRWFTRSFSV